MDTFLSAFTCGRTDHLFASRSAEDEEHIHELETLLTRFQQAYEDLRLAYEAAKDELCLYKQLFGPLDSLQVDLVKHLREEISDLRVERQTSSNRPDSTRRDGLPSPTRGAGRLAQAALRTVREEAPSDQNNEDLGTSSSSASPRRPRKGRTMSWSRQICLEGAAEEGNPRVERETEYNFDQAADARSHQPLVVLQESLQEKVGGSHRAPHERERVLRAMEDIKECAKDGMLCGLNAFQLQCIRDQARVRVFRAGEVLIHKGVQATAAVHVLLSGCVHVRERDTGCNAVLPTFSFVGHVSLLFGEALTTVVAVDDVQTLMLSKGLLECVFGQKLKDVLLRSFIFGALSRHEVFKSLRAEDLKAAADLCEVVNLAPGEDLDVANLRFALCIFGEVATSVGINGGPKRILKGSLVELFGEECLLSSDRPWNRQVTATSNAPAVIGLWRGKKLAELLDRAWANASTEEQEVG